MVSNMGMFNSARGFGSVEYWFVGLCVNAFSIIGHFVHHQSGDPSKLLSCISWILKVLVPWEWVPSIVDCGIVHSRLELQNVLGYWNFESQSSSVQFFGCD